MQPGEEFLEQEPSDNDKILLADTVLDALRMGEKLQNNVDILPVSRQYQLAISASQFRVPELTFPGDFHGLIDSDDLNLLIVTYVFGSQADRPYMELLLESDQRVVATISKPGLDASEPYRGEIAVNDETYTTKLTSEDVADFMDQVVVPSLDQIPISDPQHPSQARNIIDTLVQSQHADIIESQMFELDAPMSGSSKTDHFKIYIHSINGNPNEVEIESVIENDIGFDDMGEPVEQYRSLLCTLSFDDFSQSVRFTMVNSGEEPRELAYDREHLTVLHEDIERIFTLINRDVDEVSPEDNF